ncbi:MAG: SDR family NAD(P)-dependent oxidoreductase, partial [Nitrosarchaeum sp.]|nr:SDR family NAD(P)-dependent oxidoreductase [Nitrosarchaeum sp.]
MTRAIVLGGSRGIGKAVAESLKSIGMEVFAASRNDIDTSNLDSVKKFVQIHNQTDVLVLNTGGPTAKEFANITEEEWNRYHNQLFLGFCIILQNIKINDGGYIFLISSSVIKEPNSKLIISSASRAAFSEVFKILSKGYAAKNISCINIAPGLINTDRTRELIENIEEYKKSLPMKRLGEPEEIGNFV